MPAVIPEFHLSDRDFQTVRDVVYKHCGIALGEDKISLVRARISREMRVGGYDSVKAYLEHVLENRGGDSFAGFIDSISTNLTGFFREKEHFDYLEKIALPAVLARKRDAGDSRILLWCAACSSGEEPYTMAMSILETVERFGRVPLKWDIRILATDISTRMLAKARSGVYEPQQVAKVPEGLRMKYFQPVEGKDSGGRQYVKPEVKGMVRFRHLNLIDAWPFKGPFEFIFCRNVMIYFDKGTQQGLIDRFWNCLQPDGLLFTGHSESLMGITHRFMNVKPATYRKPGGLD